MDIILLENVPHVGAADEVVTVRNGYARNYLLPRKIAIPVTPEALAEAEERRRQRALTEKQSLEQARARAKNAVKAVTLTRLCGDEGQLYGSVSAADIATALTEAGTAVNKSEIVQPDAPIKHAGNIIAEVALHPEVHFTVEVEIAGQQPDGSRWQESTAPEAVPEADEAVAEPVEAAPEPAVAEAEEAAPEPSDAIAEPSPEDS